MSIGIGISTQNRRELALQTVQQIIKHRPPESQIIVVDDGSDIPFPQLDGITVIRNEKPTSIASVKNQCLHTLKHHDHIFLYDDDTYPITPDWYKPYIESGIDHLSYTWFKLDDGTPRAGQEKANFIHGGKSFIAYKWPCGCMLYFTHKAITAVGGFNRDYFRWGHEHVGLSMRIRNAGLTPPSPHPFLDVVDSDRLFWAYDRLNSNSHGVINHILKKVYLERNAPIYEQERIQSCWKPTGPTDFVLSAFFTRYVDPQRGQRMLANPDSIKLWADSIAKIGYTAIIFADELELENTDNLKVIRMQSPCQNPYFARWKAYQPWLEKYKPYIRDLWITDCTDVEFLHKPESKPGVLYAGDEAGQQVISRWLATQGRAYPYFNKWQNEHATEPLLNAGVVGGDKDKVLELVKLITTLPAPNNITDMPLFNVLIREFKPEFGRHITTRFKMNETQSTAWIKHK